MFENIERCMIQYNKNGKRYFDKALDTLRNQEILIYGAGSFGKEIYHLLSQNNIKVTAFLDRNYRDIQQVEGVPVYGLESYYYDKSNVTVLFSIVCDKHARNQIINQIKRSGFQNVTESQSIRCLQVNYSKEYDNSCENILERIKKGYTLLSDEKSRKIYINNIYAHFSGNYSKCPEFEDNMDSQYFPDDITFNNNYSVFIDCGGFVGDTIDSVMKKRCCEKIISFEPFIDNFKFMSELCNKYNQNTEFILFNNAVSDKISQSYFKSGTGSGTLDAQGDVVVNTVSMDSVIIGTKPTFIKMDIEGEEINALNGARKLIELNTPDLAICVYHNVDHIWEIPLLINSINPGYDFYLRSYNSYTMETVLYGFKKENL